MKLRKTHFLKTPEGSFLVSIERNRSGQPLIMEYVVKPDNRQVQWNKLRMKGALALDFILLENLEAFRAWRLSQG